MRTMTAMRSLVVVVVLAVSGCSAHARKHTNRMALGFAAAALACDWGSTRSAASNGWDGVRESNPIMGSRPEPATVDAYFVGIAALSGLAWHVLPERYRIVVPLVVGAVAVKANVNNIRNEVRVCGM